MLVRAVYIKNFKSIHEATLGPFEHCNIIIGKNDSGKSNLLEALWVLFKWFPTSPSIALPEAIQDDTWWDADTSQPIEIAALLELDSEEKLAIQMPSEYAIVGIEIDRKTNTVAQKIVDDNIREQLSKYNATLKGQTSESISIIVGQPSLSKVVPIIQKSFSMLNAARDRSANPNLFTRSPMVDEQTLTSWRTMAQPWQPRQRRPWESFKKGANGVLTQWSNLEIIQNEPVLSSPECTAHLRDTGGGTQSILRILSEVRSSSAIVAIEEPENHLHPELQKRLVKYLRKCPQQVFLTTHSPFIVDSNNLGEIWWAEYSQRTTLFTHLQGPDDLWEGLHSIGVRTSDFLYANTLLLVEGKADRAFYSSLLSKGSIGPTDILIFPMNSGDKTEYSVDAWLEQFGFRYRFPFIAVDKDAEKRARNAMSKHKIPKEHLFIARNDLEDLYPQNLLEEKAQALFVDIVKKEELEKHLEIGKRKKYLKDTLKGHSHWREDLAIAIAAVMSEEDFTPDLTDFLTRVKQEISNEQITGTL